MSDFTEQVNILIQNTNPLEEGEVILSFFQLWYLIGKTIIFKFTQSSMFSKTITSF